MIFLVMPLSKYLINIQLKANVIGDEQRDRIEFKHKNLLNLGFQQHKKYLKSIKNLALLLFAPVGKNLLVELV